MKKTDEFLRRGGVWRSLGWLLTLWLAVGGGLLARASAAPAAEPAAILTQALTLSDAPRVRVDQSLDLLRDPGRQLSAAQVARLPDSAFERLDSFSLGFTTDAAWLKFSVRPAPGAAGPWWLEVRQPLLDDVRLFTGGQDGSAEIARLPGHRRAVFPLDLPAGHTQTLYLRVVSQPAMSSTLSLWRPEALLHASTNEGFVWGGMFGAYLLVILFYGAFWLWTRERVHGVYTVYVLLNFLAAFFTGSWPEQVWPQADPDWMNVLLGLWISLSLPVGVWFTLVFIHSDRPLTALGKTVMQVCGLLAATSMALVLSGHYHLAMPAMQSTSMVAIVAILAWVLLECWRGSRAARLYLMAFSFFYAGVTWRYLRNVGWIEPSFWNDHSYQLGAFVHMLVMSVGIFASYNRLRREKEQAESRADAEASMRLEQRDFMAMVSHELRTPLTIVGASVDNLLDEPGLDSQARQRVHKIQRASDRMRGLMENYLASERLMLETQPQSTAWAPCDLSRLCAQAGQDVDDHGGSILDLRLPSSLTVWCDKELVRIAIVNLVANACRHSPPLGRVEVSLQAVDDMAVLCVRDQGPGIAESEWPHLFKRFFRGQSALNRPGTGLGLYLVQAIARRHGGSVAARNLPERGCEFCLRLPLKTPASS